MFFLSSPHPSIQTTTLLPNPQFSDAEGLTDSVSIRHAMDGTRYSYVKTKQGRRKLQWTFRVTRNKGLELRAFILSYFRSKIQVRDHNNRVWVGHLLNNPFEFETTNRAFPTIPPMLRGETQQITLEFEGVESL